MKKIFKNRKYKVLKTLDDNNMGSIARTLLSSFIVVFVFYSLPLIANFTNEKILNTKAPATPHNIICFLFLGTKFAAIEPTMTALSAVKIIVIKIILVKIMSSSIKVITYNK